MTNALNRKQAIVIGGGITGLTACYRLITESKKRGIPLDVKLLEASERVGGVIRTSKQDGFIIEHGPDAFLSVKPWAKALCEELGIEDQLIGTNPKERRSFVLRKGKLYPVPEGFYMMAPASLWPFVKTPIFSWLGKLRMGLDLFIPRGKDDDESVEHFVKRRLGKEAFTRLAQPMIGGVYTTDAKDLSLKATMPQFIEMEREYGSIIKALIARKKKSQQSVGSTSGPRYSLFLSFESGMQTLIDALVECLPDSCIQLGSQVNRVENSPDGEGWRVHLNNQERMDTDLVCVALPAWCSATLVETVAPELAKQLVSIPYASSATINLAFRREEVAHPLDGMGFVVPTGEGRSILGCSFSHVKFEGRVPAGYVLLRSFMADVFHAALFNQSESELIESVLGDLRELLGIKGTPTFATVSKHSKAMAQYHVGHLDVVSQIEAYSRKLRGFALAGNAYRGRGIPDCINSGEEAAQILLDSLRD